MTQKLTRTQISYLLWLCSFFQLHGLHRLYNGKTWTGLLWLFTFGFLWVGQFVDLFLVPSMVEEHDLKLRMRLGISENGIPLNPQTSYPSLVEPSIHPLPRASSGGISPRSISSDEVMVRLARAAQRHGGKLSVTQAVIETGVSFGEVETSLQAMLRKGYVSVDNDLRTGVVIYEFLELV